jgi:predicted kinase
MNTPRPTLLVVTGRPGTGKTTLAHALAREIRCPAICRDEIKEGFVNTTGSSGEGNDEIGRAIYATFFDCIELLLRRQITVVAEAAFQHKNWAPKLDPLRDIASIRIVICQIDSALARQRHIERGLADPKREQFHGDRAVQAAREGNLLPIGEYDPPHLDLPTLIVDTTDGYQPAIDAIVSFACAEGE